MDLENSITSFGENFASNSADLNLSNNLIALPSISRLGSKKIRKKLYMSAMVVKNHNPPFADFVKKLEKRGKCAKVIIVAVMRKLMHIFFGILKNGVPFDENLAFGS